MKTRIPKKIDDQSLKDAVVEFRYQSDLPHHLLAGILHQALPHDFILSSPDQPSVFLSLGNTQLGFQPHPNIYTYDFVRLQITDNALIFNIIGPYTGWTPFFEVIQKTIWALTGSDKITAYTRVGLRYISEFPNLKIFEKIGAKCKIELPGWQNQRNTVFKTEIWNTDHTVVINLANQVVRDTTKSELFFSLVDIDVFHVFKMPEQEHLRLIQRTDVLHNIEKETFFGLLNDDFIASLNPQY